MNDGQRLRLRLLGALFALVTILLVYRLVAIQFLTDPYWAETALLEYRSQRTVHPPRGDIYDRNGVLLATNKIEYEIGLSPHLILDREAAAEQLSAAMGLPIESLLEAMSDPEAVWVPLVGAASPAPAEMGQRVDALHLTGVVVNPLTRRYYPHTTLASHVIGFINEDNEGYGVEAYYNEVLAGDVSVQDQSRIPFQAGSQGAWRDGSDLYLTLDVEVQYLAELTLRQALQDTGASSGTIVVMDPDSGEILAMASAPDYDPNRFGYYFSTNPRVLDNPAISHQYEPGSTVKVLTAAIGLDNAAIATDFTYEDRGVLEVGGIEIHNWDNAAHGMTGLTDVLAKSLNIGAATIAIRTGPTRFYLGLEAFGLGEITGIDLDGEIPGTILRPGNENWFESTLATNAYGQGMAVTPLQLVMAISAIANDGLLMQPHIMARQVADGGDILVSEPSTIGRAVSAETARTLTLMMESALEREASKALVPGYRIAGKTGTAQIPIPGGYDPNATIASFVGFGPLDDPEFVVLVKLDRPASSEWGSETAAPIFSRFVSRLVVLLEIPPDDVRMQIQAGGG